MKKHGNSLGNKNPHHLYEIRDQQEKDVFKYGISDDPVDDDGLSNRLRGQLRFMNLVAGFTRFLGRILISGIQGRQKARALEDEYIDKYIEDHGRRPRGNIRGGKK
ncbi:hypothetical protein [Phaeodactylibacter xiamenensis]|uniref:hypothetical protein n=1 Tax=Phaeodactylibacter xiamenensis TaxID=1524460 RepID=UPI003BAC3583